VVIVKDLPAVVRLEEAHVELPLLGAARELKGLMILWMTPGQP